MAMSRSELSSDEIAEVLLRYDLANSGHLRSSAVETSAVVKESFTATRMTQGFTNTSYLLDFGGERFVLTVMDNHNYQSAMTLVSTMQHVTASGLRGPAIVATSTGEPVSNWQESCVMLKTFCPGRHPDLSDEAELFAVGKATGAMHNSLTPTDFGGYSRRLPKSWRSDLACCEDPEFLSWLNNFQHLVDEFDASGELPRGSVHGDLFPDNIVVGGDGIPFIIDWETASHDVLVFDLAMMLLGFANSGCSDISPLLAGYKSERRLNDTELAALPAFGTYSALVIAQTRFAKNNIKYKGSGDESHYREMFDFWRTADHPELFAKAR